MFTDICDKLIYPCSALQPAYLEYGMHRIYHRHTKEYGYSAACEQKGLDMCFQLW